MEVDADAALDGFLSDQARVRQQASVALERREELDPGRLVADLSRRIRATSGCGGSSLSVAAGTSGDVRTVAAVLLRKVLKRTADRLFNPSDTRFEEPWTRAGLGDLLLEALAASVPDPRLRRHVAEAVATAASSLFIRRRAWPEFALLLAQWCEQSLNERSVVLQILESLRDEAEGSVEAAVNVVGDGHGNAGVAIAGEESDAHDVGKGRSDGSVAAVRAGSSSGEDPSASLCALLAFLEDHAGALHSLLAGALRDPVDDVAQDAAARIYAFCVADAHVPGVLKAAVRDLAHVFAEVVGVERTSREGCAEAFDATDITARDTREPMMSVSAAATVAAEVFAESNALASPGRPYCSCRESCLQAIALAVRAEPDAWSQATGPAMDALPARLAAIATETRATPEVRCAALTALVELSAAASETAAKSSDCEDCESAHELMTHTAATILAIFAELPMDAATETWAETADDEGDGEAAGRNGDGANEATEEENLVIEGTESLFNAALDVSVRLIANGGTAMDVLQTAAVELLAHESWQARHAALLLLLRLACCPGEDGGGGVVTQAQSSAKAAARHMSHSHPRVRWAAFEVWGRLFMIVPEAPSALIDESIEALLTAASSDEPYLRIRRRSLLTLVLAASCPEPSFRLVHVEPIFRRVLLPLAASPDASVRDACVTIARGLAVALGVGTLSSPECSPEEFLEATAQGVAHLWRDLAEALAAGAAASASVDGNAVQESQGGSADIAWPVDWR
eukprot:TRINITY_DN67018_c0_g1_i1.p1 TRINITY_DN67018_c0_g1~~TRINITY_DN67018_c0_g1_i1.p1  ORF type:complete len:748 (+),score=145.77 TRINITY_DN67018_c0_g1_i1:112-2355(+)